jgi:GT2 family glycosyltransferase
MTDLSIIVVCYKGWDRLIKCLDTLGSYQGKNFKTEVIVVDNKSDDEMIHKIEERFPKFRFFYNHVNGGFASGCNLGAKNAAGEFILFLNPDTIAIETETEKLLNVARQNPEFGIVSCRQINEQGKIGRAHV